MVETFAGTIIVLLHEFVVAAFSVVNTFRILAYLPQIVAVCRDTTGARSVATSTWLLFLISHATTVAYAIVVVEDWRMAAIFTANGACCVAIVGLTIWKRAIHARTNTPDLPDIWRSERRSWVVRSAAVALTLWIAVVFWLVAIDKSIALLDSLNVPKLVQKQGFRD